MHDQLVTAVIHQTVRTGAVEAYEEWLKRISVVSRRSPGRLTVNVIKPTGGNRTYTIFLEFANFESLRAWLKSEQRARLMADVQDLLEEPEDVKVRTGLEFWFNPPEARQAAVEAVCADVRGVLPHHDFVQWVLSPPLKRPVFSNLFVRNLSAAITVALLVLVVMPRVTRWAAPWLFE